MSAKRFNVIVSALRTAFYAVINEKFNATTWTAEKYGYQLKIHTDNPSYTDFLKAWEYRVSGMGSVEYPIFHGGCLACDVYGIIGLRLEGKTEHPIWKAWLDIIEKEGMRDTFIAAIRSRYEEEEDDCLAITWSWWMEWIAEEVDKQKT